MVKPIKYNHSAMPKSILKYFCSLGNTRSYFQKKGEPPVYGEKLRPFNTQYLYFSNGKAYYCYMLERYYEIFEKDLIKGKIRSKEGKVLTEETVNEYLVEYAKGFNRGIEIFENEIKIDDKINLNDIDTIYKIFERVYGSMVEHGCIASYDIEFINSETRIFLSKQTLYWQGVHGGSYYKAWELILNNPLRFVDLFDGNHARSKNSNSITDKVDNNIDYNKWNELSFGLFEYFYLHFNTSKPKTKFISIWHYLEYNTDDNFVFNFSQVEYMRYIKEKHSIELKKMNKPSNFDSKQLPVLEKHYKEYLKLL